jgi:hypothetical protein
MNLKEDLEALFHRYGLDEEHHVQRALVIVVELLPSRLRSYVQPLRLRRGVLTLAVASSSVMQELRFHTPRLVEEVNLRLDQTAVRKIRFVSKPPEEDTLPAVPPLEAPATERVEGFGEVQDPALRRAFARLRMTSTARQEALRALGGRRCPRCGIIYRPSGSGGERVCPGCVYGAVERSEERD